MKKIIYPMKKTPFIPEENKRPPPVDGTEWRCICKQDLFGIFKDGVLHIQYRQRSLLTQGIIVATCRKCNWQNRLDTKNVVTNHITSRDEDEWINLITVDATDAAIELSNKNGIDLSTVQGSGKDGRIVVGDVQGVIDE